MLNKYLQLTTPVARTFNRQVMFWFSLSMTFALIYGILGLQQAFSSEYVVQDDARQHVFWMQRFFDPELFPNDFIADYFQSVAPQAYTALYQIIASVGINPLFLSKVLPIVLGLVTTGYCFGVCLEILPVPAAGFVASLLLNQTIWLKEDLGSATARAFLYPLFLAFLYYFLRRSWLPTLVAIALQGLFYPQTLLISAGVLILQLVCYERSRPRLSRNRNDYLFCAAGLVVAFLVMLPYVFESSPFGPTISEAQARALPDFLPGGRTQFFASGLWRYWICGRRSGFLPDEWCQPTWRASIQPFFLSPPIWLGFLLPSLLLFPRPFALVKYVKQVRVLLDIVLVSFFMFFAAHAVLFKLYLPSRYTQHSLRIVLAIATGISLILILDALFRWAEQQTVRKFLTLGATALVGAVLILYPSFLRVTGQEFPSPGYVTGNVPQLYEFFKQQPKDTLIASLTEETDNLPTFSQRSVLASRELAIPYHVGYQREFSQRATDLVRAQYSQNLTDAENLIQKYGVDLWLVDRAAFTPEYLVRHRWLSQRQFQPEIQAIRARLEQGLVPALAKLVDRCSVFESQGLVVMQAECIASAK
ncbi:hypothetical protein NIES1031_05545 [Chroogloeocystis siderophila 5.2 s.c.1]|uniref:Glycosyltransferase RgtA/B/C/D-like domain-containing protein n=1 Tax=Chroogloeocystis siderophila 5.2 s.c.1 TaxID=247279 RepID=A0A1U7HX62_9CHRO|nr:hypothetical protein NIES1031_05545 [Chroogloeocystis siderophila 5.2 s.c.1]